MKKQIAYLAIGAAIVAPVLLVGVNYAKADALSDLQAQIATLQAQLNSALQQINNLSSDSSSTIAPTSSTSVQSEICNFYRDLKQGMSGEDVRCLQKYLNGASFTINTGTKPGAPGYESTYFGNRTKNAVVDWQNANYISPSNGYFGALSRAKYLELVNIGGIPQPPLPPLPPPPPVASTITVNTPNGGENWKIGETRSIKWKDSGGTTNQKYTIYITNKYGGGYGVAGEAVGTDQVKWVVGNLTNGFYTDLKPGTDYYVQVVKQDGSGSYDMSDKPFSIFAQTSGDSNKITLISPNGGEQWQLNSLHTVQWTPYDPNLGVNSSGVVSAYLEKRGSDGKYTTIGKIIPSGKASIHWSGEIDKYGNYPVPGDYYIRVENAQTRKSDRSDQPFKIVAAGTVSVDLKINNSDGPIKVPAGGANYTVSWTSNAQSCTFYNYASGYDVKSNLPASGSFVTNFNPSSNISVTMWCDSKTPIEATTADSIDVIPAEPSTFIAVTAPNGGEVLDWASPFAIVWNVSQNIEKISLALYKNDSFFNWIATNIPIGSAGYGNFAWTPSGTLSSANVGNNIFKIYMIGYKSGGGTLEDKSDSPFSITYTPTTTQDVIIGVATDKSTYSDNESIKITVSATNNNSSPVTLNFPSACQVEYSVAFYDSAKDTLCAQITTSVYIPANSTHYWNIVHSPSTYKIPSGSFKLQGRVIGYGDATTVVTINGSPATTAVKVLSPNGGEKYTHGQTMGITWSGGSAPYTLKLLKGSALHKVVVTNWQFGSYYFWQIPTDVDHANNYVVEITDGNGNADKSDAQFSIQRASADASQLSALANSLEVIKALLDQITKSVNSLR